MRSNITQNGTKKSLPFFGLGKIIPYLHKYRKIIAAMIICGLAGSMLDISIPLFQRYALNHFIGNKTLDTLVYFIILYAAAIIATGVINYIACTYAMTIEVSINKDLRNAAFSHLQTLSFSYFNQNNVGNIHARIMSDTSRIGSLVSWTMMDSVWHSSYFIGSVIVSMS